MEIESLIINTIGANIQNEIKIDSPFVKNDFLLSSPRGIYMNLFYKYLSTVQTISNEKEFNRSFNSYFKDEDRELPNFYSDFYKFIKSLRLKSMSRILNLSKLIREYSFNEVM